MCSAGVLPEDKLIKIMVKSAKIWSLGVKSLVRRRKPLNMIKMTAVSDLNVFLCNIIKKIISSIIIFYAKWNKRVLRYRLTGANCYQG